MQENLPVKLFKKREQDLLRVEGGPVTPPSWLLTDNELVFRQKSLIEDLENVKNDLTSRNSSIPDFVPFVIQVDLIDEAKAKTHKKQVTKFLNSKKDSFEIGLDGDSSLLISVTSTSVITELQDSLKDADKMDYIISSIEEIKSFQINVENFELIEEKKFKLKLFNFLDYEKNRVVLNYIKEQLEAFEINYKDANYSKDLLVLKLSNLSQDKLDLIINNIPFYVLDEMPIYSINENSIEGPASSVQKLAYDSTQDYPVIGVLDSGIKINSLNQDWILGRYSNYLDDDLDTEHGTFVSGIILYGDILENDEMTGITQCKILDVPVVCSNTDEDELIDNIRSAISLYHETIKVWNLSVSVVKEIENETFSDIAIALDQIQDEFDVLIFKSAGNSSAYTLGKPKEKIHAPGDSVRSVIVGSISKTDDSTNSFSKADYPSPYTRIGRGPARIIKPDLVHYGGDIHQNPLNKKFIHIGAKSITEDEKITSKCGTSFSTPRVAAIAAGLQHQIDGDFDSLLLKGLLIHSSNYGSASSLNPETRLEQLGFGKPKSVNEILYNDQHEITLILRDTLKKGKFIDIMDFPFPESLVDDDGNFTGQLTVTLAYNPLLKENQGSEYCQSNINVAMGTYQQKQNKDLTKRNVLNPIKRDGSKNALLKSNYTKRLNPASNFSKERMLINFGDKFYPIKKYCVDLSEMTSANKSAILNSNRKWYLKVEGLYREFIEQEAGKTNEELSMDFCVLVTIKDPTKSKDIYSETIHSLDLNAFIHEDVKVKNQIQINNSI